ncbi:hypothetical protein ONS95_000093 [Cadophora gregata]|uniref:uncharacterized protein n=1 Tax=Cadophora gregata TaxID=51156 RepID=UPI0026DC4BB5|nr:uncharacterized protein ONS95_000093 [Cadophora gregata]KAK0115636.1 hypothetical protein ONS96_014083 [Cadophora gregata f. sp. sojae]KAK0128108.1 hypothetical protein ONS95_000093 [Cadophora gregata]
MDLESNVYFLALPALVVYLCAVILGRLFFHPLSKIPGPKLASITRSYIFYYNATGGSRFYLQVEKLHEKYGPIIRIAPYEIHLSDPENHEKIYRAGSKYTKEPTFYAAFGCETAAFSTPSNSLHRTRRAALNPLFSRKRVLDLEDVVQSKVAKLDQRLRDAASTGEEVDLHYGLRAISVDTITDYGFGKSYDLLEREDLGRGFFEMMRKLGPAIWFFQQWPFLQPVALGIPEWLARRVSSNLGTTMQLQSECRDNIVVIKKAMEAGVKDESRTTIFHQLLDPNATEGHVVPSVDNLTDEGFVILGAASDTTGNAMTVAMHGVVRNPAIYAKLTAELNEAFPDPTVTLDFITLEKLPYLTAVIKEGLRLSYGVIGRLPRVVNEPGVSFHGFDIPPCTIVGMSAYMMHRNPEHFPNPDTFDPERWTEPGAARRLDKYLVPFSKGQRQCIGMPLAYCEIYVTLGTLLRRHQNLKAMPMSEEDLVYQVYFAAYPPIDAKKFRVTV